jgi:hypothetical protein
MGWRPDYFYGWYIKDDGGQGKEKPLRRRPLHENGVEGGCPGTLRYFGVIFEFGDCVACPRTDISQIALAGNPKPVPKTGACPRQHGAASLQALESKRISIRVLLLDGMSDSLIYKFYKW